MTSDATRERRRPTVLVLCTGNLCRSPLVEAMLRDRLSHAGRRVDVFSAGLAAPLDRRPDGKLQRVAREHGVDVSSHRSRPVTDHLLSSADLVVVMTRRHEEQVNALRPDAKSRTALLRAASWKARAISPHAVPFPEWVRLLASEVPDAERSSTTTEDIADPIGRPLRRYREMAADVESYVEALVRHWPTD